MHAFFTVWYWLHWFLDVALFVAGMSLIFRPYLIARIYFTVFLAQQLVLNGCLMTKIQNHVASAHAYTTSPNKFIMAEVVHGPIIEVYKALFAVLVVWQGYYIVKEIKSWTITRQSKRAI